MRSVLADDQLIQLAERIRSGDVAAFEEVFRAFHAPLCEVVDSYVRSQDAAEEIVQDLFFVVWMKRERLGRVALRPYLFTAARNQALHYLRHQAVARRWSLRATDDPSVDSSSRAPALPDRELEASEVASALADAVAALPPRARLAFVLRTQHEMSYAEVASAMGISVKGVEKLMSIANAHLRARLGAHADRSLPRD